MHAESGMVAGDVRGGGREGRGGNGGTPRVYGDAIGMPRPGACGDGNGRVGAAGPAARVG